MFNIRKLRASKSTPTTKLLTVAAGTLNFRASAEGEKAPPRFTILANSGGRMDGSCIDSEFDVVVDLLGVTFAKAKTTVLEDHDPSRRIGHAIGKVSADGVTAKGVVSASSPAATNFVLEASAGFPYQASLGADTKCEFIPLGDTVVVNGQSFDGPLMVARKTLVNEFSVTTFGADPETSVSLAAMAAQQKRGQDMEPELIAHIEALGFNPKSLTEGQVTKMRASLKRSTELETKQKAFDLKAEQDATDAVLTDDDETKKMEATRQKAADEEDRMDSVRMFARQYADLDVRKVTVDGEVITLQAAKKRAMAKGWSADKFEMCCLRAARTPVEGSGPAFHIQDAGFDSEDEERDVYAAGLMRAHGTIPMNAKDDKGEKWGMEPWYGDKVLSRADKLGTIDLHTLMDRTILASGAHYSGSRRSDGFVKAFYSADRKLRMEAANYGTHSISNILENVAHKTLDAGYLQQGTIWNEISKTKSLDDFKPHATYMLHTSGGYDVAGPDGTLPHAHLTDSKSTVEADTRGQILVIGRKQLRNDDLGALQDSSELLGRNAAICIEEEVLGFLLSNRANWTTGGASDMNIAGITAAELIFSKQIDAKKSPILVPPDRIVCGVGDSVTAKALFGTANLLADGVGSSASRDFAVNPHTGKYRPLPSPYLDNTTIRKQSTGKALTNQDANQWYLMCDPRVLAAIVIGFLDGNTRPTVESDAMPFENIGGIRFKIFHDWGIGQGNVKGIVFNAGA